MFNKNLVNMHVKLVGSSTYKKVQNHWITWNVGQIRLGRVCLTTRFYPFAWLPVSILLNVTLQHIWMAVTSVPVWLPRSKNNICTSPVTLIQEPQWVFLLSLADTSLRKREQAIQTGFLHFILLRTYMCRDFWAFAASSLELYRTTAFPWVKLRWNVIRGPCCMHRVRRVEPSI